jgi:isopenicillin N synthase-like dioxygenase
MFVRRYLDGLWIYCSHHLAKSVLEMFALALQLPRDYFGDKINKSLDFLRVLNYPALTTPPRPGLRGRRRFLDHGVDWETL